MTPFPLLKLPFVAMRHVLSMMTPFELINVSLISSRAKSIVTNFGPRFKGYLDTSLVITLYDNGVWRYTMTSDESKDDEVTSSDPRIQESFKYSKDPIEEWKKWYKYIKEVLRCRFYRVVFDLNSPGPGFREILDWLKCQQDVFDTMSIRSNQECGDDLNYILGAFPNVSELTIMVSNFKEDFKIKIPNGLNQLLIPNATFIDIEQFLKLNAQTIVFIEHILTNEEINRFVRGWMSMETHVGLKTLCLQMENEERFNGMLTGIPFQQITDVEVLKACEHGLQGNDMFIIERCDGKRCLVYVLSRVYLHMQVL
uniref:F-box domain-containing protein n=1 Tax=Caenorhabditis tropicalis TaxID=1561998 RepID=A0A1I7UU06_9PELO